jgi:hypothetical protein
MGNLVSLHKNDFDRIYDFLRFFGKKIILRTSKGYIFYKNDDKTCSLKDFTESIIDNIYKGSFEHLVIEIFEDIKSLVGHRISLSKLKESLTTIIQDMIGDGFDEEDIFEYIKGIVIDKIEDADWE